MEAKECKKAYISAYKRCSPAGAGPIEYFTSWSGTLQTFNESDSSFSSWGGAVMGNSPARARRREVATFLCLIGFGRERERA